MCADLQDVQTLNTYNCPGARVFYEIYNTLVLLLLLENYVELERILISALVYAFTVPPYHHFHPVNKVERERGERIL